MILMSRKLKNIILVTLLVLFCASTDFTMNYPKNHIDNLLLIRI